MLKIHRFIALFGGLLLVYIALTGLGTQLADMRALVFHAPETDPDMLMMRQHITGTPNYSVASAPDYTAPALPAGLDYNALLAKTAALGRAAIPGGELRLVEVRTAEGKLAGHVQMNQTHLIFDLATGQRLPDTDLPPPVPANDFTSLRSTIKGLHRFNYLGQPFTGLDLLAGLGFGTLIVTGLIQYFRILRSRAAIGRRGIFWQSGGWWRNLHRWFSVVASLLVIWLTLTGIALSLDNFYPAAAQWFSAPRIHHPGEISGFDGDLSTPMTNAELPAMTKITLDSFRSLHPDLGIKVLRLRYFSGYAQGVIVAADSDTSQFVFNAVTGKPMSMQEPGYPNLGFPSGWEWHQRLKRMHRGDFFGMPGRWLDTLGGIALAYLSISGLVMYYQLWRKRARVGRKSLVF